MRRLWTAQILSEIGDWAARLSLALLVFERSGSAGLSALVTAVALIPWVGIGQWLATFGDRLPRRAVMVGSDLFRAAVFLVLLIPMPVPLVLALVFLASCATPPFEAARSALLPTAAGPDRYSAAIALTSATYQLAIILGALLGGSVAAAIGVRWAIALNAGSFLASAAVLTRLELGSRPADEAAESTVRGGWQAVRSNPYVFRAIGVYASVSACAIVVEALAPAYATKIVGGTASVAGIAIAAVAFGDFCASAAIRVVGSSTHLLRLSSVIAAAGAGAACIAFLLPVHTVTALVGFVAVGVIFASGIPANTVMGTEVPDDIRASAFGILNGVLRATNAVAAIAAVGLASAVGIRATYVTVAVSAFAVGCWGIAVRVRPTTQPSS
jgi:MFS family permease